MKFRPGMYAPTFRAIDLFGTTIDLAEYRGKSLLLSFFRNAACAICNLRVHKLIEHHAEYRREGLELVAVFESPAASMRKYVGKQEAPFPLIADPEARLYTLYGVENSEAKIATSMTMPEADEMATAAAAQGFPLTKEEGSNFLRMPADFYIGPDGMILAAHYANYAWDHLPFAQIEELLGIAVPSR